MGIDNQLKKCYFIKAVARQYGLVAQLDRVFDYESKGRWFESRRAHQKRP